MTSRLAEDERAFRKKAPEDAVRIELEAPFHDVDPLFVVWHGWYYKYFELARTALFRAHRIDVPDMIPMKLGFYVVETRCKHVRALRYGERFHVLAWFGEVETRVVVHYEVSSLKGERVARGKTVLVTTQRTSNLDSADPMLFETPPILLERIRGPRVTS